MKYIKLALVLGLMTFALTVSATFVLAHRSSPSAYYGIEDFVSATESEDWWEEMTEHMRYRWGDAVDEEWFTEMRNYMEEHFVEARSQEWFDDMQAFMDERWDSEEYGYRYGGYGGYGRHGGFGGCH